MSTDRRGPGPHDDEELRLSPSETMAHNSAMRISGARGEAPSTQRALASIVLGFELIIVVLIGLSIFGLSAVDPRELGLYGAGAFALLIIVALAIMRRGRIGIVLGWIVHAMLLASGLILPAAFFVGLLFTALWVFCMIRGSQIDRERAARIASQLD